MNFDFSFVSWSVIKQYILPGLQFTIEITLITGVLGFILGTFIALMRMSSRKYLSIPATIYIVIMRSIPLLMVILWFFLLIPLFIGYPIGDRYSAYITFTAFEAAYFAEIMRAGIKNIPQGQSYAADALGMSYWQKIYVVILPQAFRNMIPVILTQFIILFQDTSLVYAIGAYDLLKGFEQIGKNYARMEENYLLAAILYFAICFTLSKIVRNLQQKIKIIH